MVRGLVYSAFPGIDGLGRGFEQEGYCVVRGADPLWGGDVRETHLPAWCFEGLIGGPPCQMFSRLRYLNPSCGQKHGNLIPDFARLVDEAQPAWFVMENVPEAPEPVVRGYVVRSLVLNNRWLGAEQNRVRRFSFGTRDGRRLDISPDLAIFEAPLNVQAVTSSAQPGSVALVRDGTGGHRPKRALRGAVVLAGHGGLSSEAMERRHIAARSVAEMCELQGLPRDFADELPFTEHGKRRVIGNMVPLPMALAIARAVKRAMEPSA